jgi:hypothetical protein
MKMVGDAGFEPVIMPRKALFQAIQKSCSNGVVTVAFIKATQE